MAVCPATGADMFHIPPEDEFETIYVASFVHPKTKQRIYASQYGLKAFPLKVRRRKNDN